MNACALCTLSPHIAIEAVLVFGVCYYMCFAVLGFCTEYHTNRLMEIHKRQRLCIHHSWNAVKSVALSLSPSHYGQHAFFTYLAIMHRKQYTQHRINTYTSIHPILNAIRKAFRKKQKTTLTLKLLKCGCVALIVWFNVCCAVVYVQWQEQLNPLRKRS